MKEGRFSILAKWSQTYGKVFCYYEGSKPVLVVADPDMVREILIKQFHKSEERNLIFNNTKDPNATLIDSAGERWKRVRDISRSNIQWKENEDYDTPCSRKHQQACGATGRSG